ncbi:MAG: DUF4386 family protein [Pseudomonadota bacterium]
MTDRFARLAGAMFLLVIVSYVLAQVLYEAEAFQRAAVAIFIVHALLTMVLALSLHVVLSATDADLALAALLGRFVEATFFALAALTRPAELSDQLTLVALIFFGVGSTIFYYLLLRSSYIPTFIAWLGVVGSLLAFVWGFVNMLLGAEQQLPIYYIGPVTLAEVLAGFILLRSGIGYEKSKSGEQHY